MALLDFLYTSDGEQNADCDHLSTTLVHITSETLFCCFFLSNLQSSASVVFSAIFGKHDVTRVLIGYNYDGFADWANQNDNAAAVAEQIFARICILTGAWYTTRQGGPLIQKRNFLTFHWQKSYYFWSVFFSGNLKFWEILSRTQQNPD